MPLRAKIVPKLCTVCGTNEEDKFSQYVYNKCRQCKKSSSKKEYLCKYCGAFDKDNFYEGRYSNCKKCYNSYKNSIKKEEKLREEVSDKCYTSIPGIEITSQIDIKKAVRSFLHLDYDLFDGLTLKQVINEIKIEYIELNKKLVKAENEIDKLNDKIKNITYEFNKIDKRIDDNLIISNLSQVKF